MSFRNYYNNAFLILRGKLMMLDYYFLKKTVNSHKKFKKIRYIFNELEAGSTFDMGTWPSDLALSKAEIVVKGSQRSKRLKIQV